MKGIWLWAGLLMILVSILSISCADRGVDPPPARTPVNSVEISEKRFLAGTNFWLTDVDGTFLDSARQNYFDLPNFRENYRHFVNRQHVAPQDHIFDLRVFVSVPGNTTPGDSLFVGRAAALQFFGDLSLAEFPDDRNHVRAYWKQLVDWANEYTVDRQLGVLRLRNALIPGQMLACAFTVTSDTSFKFGTADAPQDSLSLVLLWGEDPSPTDSTWNLMFRHVYPMQAVNVDRNNLRFTISRYNPNHLIDESGPQIPGFCPPEVHGVCSYLSFFGFDYETGGIPGVDGSIDNYASLVDWERGEIQFLDLTPFNPSGYWNAHTFGGANDSAYYVRSGLEALEQAAGDTTGYIIPYLYNSRPTQYSARESYWKLQFDFYE